MKKVFALIFFVIPVVVFSQGLYDTNHVPVLKITFPSSNWHNTMVSNYGANKDGTTRIMANIDIDGTLIDSVGIRYKGWSSFNTAFPKLPLNIDLNHFIPNSYQGYKKFKLANAFIDPSFLRDVLTFEVARKYMSAPKSNLIKVYINGTYRGVYTNTETIDKNFLADHFEENDNEFYKMGANYNWVNPSYGTNCSVSGTYCSLDYLGQDTMCYRKYYTNKNLEHSWQYLINVADTLENHLGNIDEILNVDVALWYLAMNNVFMNMDSYIGKFQHNYYSFKDQDGRFNMLIWDLNHSFGGSGKWLAGSSQILNITQKENYDPLAHINNSKYPLIKNLLSNSDYKKRYMAHMRTIVAENLTNGWASTRATQWHNQINSSVLADTYKLYPYFTFTDNLNDTTRLTGYGRTDELPGIKTFLTNRKNYLTGHSEFSKVAPAHSSKSFTYAAGNRNEIIFKIFSSASTSVNVYWAPLNSNKFTKVTMFDDGAHSDWAANDGMWGVKVSRAGHAIKYYYELSNSQAMILEPERAEYEFLVIPNAVQSGDIVLNELMADNVSYIADQNGQFDDWIEIYNTTSSSLPLGGLYLSDDHANLQKWEFPDTAIAPGDYMIVWADENGSQPGLHANFKLSKFGEAVYLVQTDGNIIDSTSWGAQYPDTSWARIPNATGPFKTTQSTFKALNFENPLPVELSDFSVRYLDCYPKLDWVALHKENIEIFIIERSVDGKSFKEAGRVESFNGGSSYFSFVDQIDLSADAYYRLKLVYFDGRTALSDIKLFRNPCNNYSEAMLKLSPNPTSESIKLELFNFPPSIGTISITDIRGREVYRSAFDAVRFTEKKINLKNYLISPGIYLLQARFENYYVNKKFVFNP